MTLLRAVLAVTLAVATGSAAADGADAGRPAGEPVDLEGVLELSKGNLVVGGYFLARKEATELLHARDVGSLAGTRVRLRGLAGVHVCKPDEQCLMGGRIPVMLRIDSLEVLAAPDGGAAPAAKRCPGVQCFDLCCQQGEACAHGGTDPTVHKCVRVPR